MHSKMQKSALKVSNHFNLVNSLDSENLPILNHNDIAQALSKSSLDLKSDSFEN